MRNAPYQDYSLETLDGWVRDVVESDCSPDEIYNSMIDTVKKNIQYHRACYNDSIRLLALLKGNSNKDIMVHDGLSQED